jgi:hypothetical protein
MNNFYRDVITEYDQYSATFSMAMLYDGGSEEQVKASNPRARHNHGTSAF